MDYLIISSSFNRFAGPNNPLLDLCNYLYQDLNVNLALLTHDTIFDESFEKNINFPLLRMLSGSRLKSSNRLKKWFTRLLYASKNVKIIRKVIGNLSSEKVFVNASIDTLLEAYWATGRRLRVGYNVFPNRESLFFLLMDRLVAKYTVSRIVAHTQFKKGIYVGRGIAKEKISIIPHCIDTKRIERMAFGRSISKVDEKPIIFYVGRLIVEKGIKELISAFQTLSKEIPSTLMMVGDGPMKKWLLEKKRVIDRDGISKMVLLEGWQPPEKFLHYMAQATVVAMPTHYESFGMVILEAMALKKAIVTTKVGGIPEIIKDGFNGLLVEPRNEEQLGEALLKVVTNPTLRRRLGSNASQTIREKYDVSVVAPKFLQFIEEDF